MLEIMVLLFPVDTFINNVVIITCIQIGSWWPLHPSLSDWETTALCFQYVVLQSAVSLLCTLYCI